MSAPRLCPECRIREICRYDEACVACLARKWMGITHLPRSHVPVVLDPDGRDALCGSEADDEAHYRAAVMAGEEETP